jgi:Tfp pilus assembly protein PilF
VTARYFERFRTAAARFAEGVHWLGAPASETAIGARERALGRSLPEEYRQFLRSWEGARLFHDDLVLFTLDGCATDGELVWIAESAAGDRYAIERARVVEQEEETGLRWIAASGFERWLDLVMAKGEAIYDRDGEFKEGAFVGDELAPRVALAVARRQVRLDPEAPKPRYELGMALVRLGEAGAAERELERATELDAAAAWAWFDLGRLRWRRGEARPAALAFARAADGRGGEVHGGYFLAWAARAAQGAGDDRARAEHAARARALKPDVAAEQLAAARHRLQKGQSAEARELCELALAVAPRDLSALALLAELKMHRAR